MLVYFKSGYDRLMHRFPGRAVEWGESLILSTVGWTLLIAQTPALFTRPYFQHMASMASQEVWGYGCLTIGLLRVVFLFVNGTMPRTSSYLRAIGAFFSIFCWFSISYGLAQHEFVGLGMSVFPWLLIGDMYSLHRASTDMRLADNVSRENKRNGITGHGSTFA